MSVAGYRTIPLVDAERRPIGIVTVTNIIKWLAHLFPEAVLNLPPGDTIKRPHGGGRGVGRGFGMPTKGDDDYMSDGTPGIGAQKPRRDADRAVVRFAGDSGDGMQVTGEQFTTESAWAGNDISTLPNFPAEIRAPAGTLFGVSSFQLQFGSQRVYTPGDRLDCLVAMNPAALKVHLVDLKDGGLLIRQHERLRPARTSTRPAIRRTRWRTRPWPSGTACTRSTSRG